MKEKIKYDFTKCNNLEFKGDLDGKPINGYLKITESGEVYVFFFGTELSYDVKLQLDFMDYRAKFLNIHSFSQWAESVNLEIVPRNPRIYNDWKVGDVIKCKDFESEHYIIVATLGEVIFATDMLKKCVYIMSAKNITENYNLVLTDYEQELLKGQEQKKCPFKKGDKVIVRDSACDKWRFEIFESYKENSAEPYCVESTLSLSYHQCAPLNERTWQLLGTNNEYKEKE